jgi:uncharacterized membrane protein
MQPEFIKWIHILSTAVLFGTGLGIAFFKWASDRINDVATIDQVNRLVVQADWWFTTPAILVQAMTGGLLVHLQGYQWQEPWLLISIGLFLLAGLCWLPVVYLQIRMRRFTSLAIANSALLNTQYYRMTRQWFWLGVPAFISLIIVFYLMAVKPTISVLS